MIMSEENYLPFVIEDVYSILTRADKKTPWPLAVDTVKKRAGFLQSIIDYFADREEFEKCIVLRDMINELETYGDQN
jgi:protein-arginine kinase activator protein McsA